MVLLRPSRYAAVVNRGTRKLAAAVFAAALTVGVGSCSDDTTTDEEVGPVDDVDQETNDGREDVDRPRVPDTGA